MTSSLPLTPLARADFDAIAALARAIWLEHYISIISKEQIEYMLAGRFTAQNLEKYLDAPDRWFRVLRADGEIVGYCSWSLSGQPREMKLEQLYLLPRLHGRGLGRRMMELIETDARARGCDTLMLTVNKHNTTASRVYFAAGFQVREEAVFDIGNGYVMDDYVMEKRLAPPGP